ncbi:unnamed protein product [Lampetra planeri]
MSSALVQRSTGDTGVLVYTHAVIKHRPRPTGETPFKVPPRAAPTDVSPVGARSEAKTPRVASPAKSVPSSPGPPTQHSESITSYPFSPGRNVSGYSSDSDCGRSGDTLKANGRAGVKTRARKESKARISKPTRATVPIGGGVRGTHDGLSSQSEGEQSQAANETAKQRGDASGRERTAQFTIKPAHIRARIKSQPDPEQLEGDAKFKSKRLVKDLVKIYSLPVDKQLESWSQEVDVKAQGAGGGNGTDVTESLTQLRTDSRASRVKDESKSAGQARHSSSSSLNGIKASFNGVEPKEIMANIGIEQLPETWDTQSGGIAEVQGTILNNHDEAEGMEADRQSNSAVLQGRVCADKLDSWGTASSPARSQRKSPRGGQIVRRHVLSHGGEDRPSGEEEALESSGSDSDRGEVGGANPSERNSIGNPHRNLPHATMLEGTGTSLPRSARSVQLLDAEGGVTEGPQDTSTKAAAQNHPRSPRVRLEQSDWQLKENKAMPQQRRQLQATEAAWEAQRAPAGASRPSTSHAADVLRAEIIRLSERVSALEGELRQAHNALKQAEKAEKSLVTEKVSLHKELEDTQGALERLSEGRLGVEGRLREAERAAATLRRDKEELEQRGRQQQHAIERLHRELQAARQEVSRASGSAELAGSRGGSGDGPGSEMERALQQKSRLQEMVENLTVELEDQTAERETLALQTRRLERRVGELEAELETAMAERDATFKQHKQLEDRNKELQMEYAEQCENLDLMMKKVNRLREQKDELRAELEQKCVDIESLKNDNAALERQNDDLRGRVSELESLGSRDQGALLSELEGRLRTLEAHLEATEREKERLQAEGRRLEENVVGVTRRLESERTQTNSEREQVKQQLWSLRQQGEESERQLEHALGMNKQLQHELNKQRSANEGHLVELGALRKDLRQRAAAPTTRSGQPLRSSSFPPEATEDPYANDDSDLPVAVF